MASPKLIAGKFHLGQRVTTISGGGTVVGGPLASRRSRTSSLVVVRLDVQGPTETPWAFFWRQGEVS